MQAIKCMSQPPRRREIRIISVISCFLLNWIINSKQGTQWEQGKVMNKITHHGVIPFCFMPWNYRFHGMKQNGITPWWVILFMTLPCSHCVPCLEFIIQLSKKQEITDIILISLLLGGCDIHLIACISLLFSSFFSSSQLSGQNNGFSAN